VNKTEAISILHQTLGYYQQNGAEYLFGCPVCNHHKNKLSINIDKNFFKCWICDYRGRNIRRIIRRFGSFTLLQKWDQITNRIDLDRFSDLFSEPEPEVKQKLMLPPEFDTLASKKLPTVAYPAYNYLRKRGVSDADILRWKIGYCNTGEYYKRIIIPSFDNDGDINYFVGRTYNNSSYRYKNPRASKNIIFNELYVNWNKDLTITEGVFDAIIAGNAIPLLGSTIQANSKLVRKIVLNDTPVYLALDADASKKEQKIIKTLLQYDIELYKIDTTGYEDVGEMPREVFNQRKKQATFIDNDDYLLRNLLLAI